MKFTITTDGSDVDIKITFRCGYAGEYEYVFSHDTGHNSYAGLVAKAIDDQFQRHIEAIRKSAYEQGWNDKKKRNRKRTDFDWCPNTIHMY